MTESLCLFLSSIFFNNSYLKMLYILRGKLLICWAQQYFLEDVSLCIILIAALANTRVDGKSWCNDQWLIFQLSRFFGNMVSPAGTDVCFTVTTFLAFNLVVCVRFFFWCSILEMLVLFICFVYYQQHRWPCLLLQRFT